MLDDHKKDFHTVYVVFISYPLRNNTVHTWQLNLRYNAFKTLNGVVQRHMHDTTILAEFPFSTVTDNLMGIDDAKRTERMRKFDAWLREITNNPILMTTLDIADAIYKMLDFGKSVNPNDI